MASSDDILKKYGATRSQYGASGTVSNTVGKTNNTSSTTSNTSSADDILKKYGTARSKYGAVSNALQGEYDVADTSTHFDATGTKNTSKVVVPSTSTFQNDVNQETGVTNSVPNNTSLNSKLKEFYDNRAGEETNSGSAITVDLNKAKETGKVDTTTEQTILASKVKKTSETSTNSGAITLDDDTEVADTMTFGQKLANIIGSGVKNWASGISGTLTSAYQAGETTRSDVLEGKVESLEREVQFMQNTLDEDIASGADEKTLEQDRQMLKAAQDQYNAYYKAFHIDDNSQVTNATQELNNQLEQSAQEQQQAVIDTTNTKAGELLVKAATSVVENALDTVANVVIFGPEYLLGGGADYLASLEKAGVKNFKEYVAKEGVESATEEVKKKLSGKSLKNIVNNIANAVQDGGATMLTFYLRSYGNAATQGRNDEDKNMLEVSAFATATALKEIATELMSNTTFRDVGMRNAPSDLDDLISSGVEKVVNAVFKSKGSEGLKDFMVDLVSGTAGEAIEEGVGTFVENYLINPAFNVEDENGNETTWSDTVKWEYFVDTLSSALESMAIGGLSGGLMAGTSSAVRNVANSARNNVNTNSPIIGSSSTVEKAQTPIIETPVEITPTNTSSSIYKFTGVKEGSVDAESKAKAKVVQRAKEAMDIINSGDLSENNILRLRAIKKLIDASLSSDIIDDETKVTLAEQYNAISEALGSQDRVNPDMYKPKESATIDQEESKPTHFNPDAYAESQGGIFSDWRNLATQYLGGYNIHDYENEEAFKKFLVKLAGAMNDEGHAELENLTKADKFAEELGIPNWRVLADANNIKYTDEDLADKESFTELANKIKQFANSDTKQNASTEKAQNDKPAEQTFPETSNAKDEATQLANEKGISVIENPYGRDLGFTQVKVVNSNGNGLDITIEQDSDWNKVKDAVNTLSKETATQEAMPVQATANESGNIQTSGTSNNTGATTSATPVSTTTNSTQSSDTFSREDVYSYNPEWLLERLKYNPDRQYDETERNRVKQELKVTLEDIDRVLAQGSLTEGGKKRIYDFFSEKHTQAEKVAFLKNEYGIGGSSGRGTSYDFDGKGMSFSNELIAGPKQDDAGLLDIIRGEKTIMNWSNVAKRIDDLIADGKYIVENNDNSWYKDIYPEYKHPSRVIQMPNDEETELWADNEEKARIEYNLTDDEDISVSSYVCGKAYELNIGMRSGEELEPVMKLMADNIISASEKLPKFSGIVYRNLTFKSELDYNKYIEEHSVNSDVTYKAFSSTSHDPNGYTVEGDYVVHEVIQCIDGTELDGNYGCPIQSEVLLMPDTTVHVDNVTKANDGNILIYAKGVKQNGNELESNNESQRSETDKGREVQNASGKGNDNEGVHENGRVQGSVSGQPSEVLESGRVQDNEVGTSIEEAKQELKKAITIGLETNNYDALMYAVETGQLSMDVVELKGSVDGLTNQQRLALAKNLIENVGSDSKTIKTDVPYDGTFEVNNDPKSVCKILDAIKVKVRQSALISKKLATWMKTNESMQGNYGDGNYYIVSNAMLLSVPKETYDYIIDNKSKYNVSGSSELSRNIKDLISGEYTDIEAQPTESDAKNIKVYTFTQDGESSFNKKYVDTVCSLFENSTLQLSENTGFARGKRMLRAIGLNDEVLAFVMPVDYPELTNTIPATIKQLTPKKRAEIEKLKGKAAKSEKSTETTPKPNTNDEDLDIGTPQADWTVEQIREWQRRGKEKLAQKASEKVLGSKAETNKTNTEKATVTKPKTQTKNSATGKTTKAGSKTEKASSTVGANGIDFGGLEKAFGDIKSNDPEQYAKLMNLMNSAMQNGIINGEETSSISGNDKYLAESNTVDNMSNAAKMDMLLQLYFKDKESLNMVAPDIVKAIEDLGYDQYFMLYLSPEEVKERLGKNNESQTDRNVPEGTESNEVQGSGAGEQTGADNRKPDVREPRNDGTDEGENTGSGNGGSELEQNGRTGETKRSSADRDTDRGSGKKQNGEQDSGFVITSDPMNQTPVQRYDSNVDAIKTLSKIIEEGRTVATQEEKDILAKYTGWGGLKEAFLEGTGPWGNRSKALRELVGRDRFYELSATSLDAFYTPLNVVNGMYDIVNRLGFGNGNILEPSCGSGIFMGAMPNSIRNNTINAVEIDPTTGMIAKLLYPNANVTIDGFQNVNIPENSVDLIIGNVPFGSDRIPYEKYAKRLHTKNLKIEDYFILRGLDLLREGGVMTVLTSTSTLDTSSEEFRRLLHDKAVLVKAFRLPSGTFSNTKISTDLLVFQKKYSDAGLYSKQLAFDNNFEEVKKGANSRKYNEYFIEHPQDMLGKLSTDFRGNVYVEYDGRDKDTLVQDVVDRLPENIIGSEKQIAYNKAVADKPTYTELERQINALKHFGMAESSVAEDQIVLQDGKLYRVYKGELVAPYKVVEIKENKKSVRDAEGNKTFKAVPIKEGSKDYQRIVQLNKIIYAYQDYIKAQEISDKEEDIVKPREILNKEYDAYIDNFKTGKGETVFLNSPQTKTAFRSDSRYGLLLSLENSVYKDGQKTFEKADLFTKRNVNITKSIQNIESAEDALVASFNVKGYLDIDYMADIYHKSKEDVLKELGDNVFLNPATGRYEQRDEYLGGNVKEKLNYAKEHNEDGKYDANIKALEKVIPPDVGPNDIKFTLGSTWIPEYAVKKFIDHLADEEDSATEVTFVPFDGSWKITDFPINDSINKWTTKDIEAEELFYKTINQMPIEIAYYTQDKKRVVLEKETANAKAKSEAIKDEFVRWAFNDKEQRDSLVQAYNDKMNTTIDKKYDGSILKLPGACIAPYDHQKNAIYRIITQPATLLAHAAGSGKTFSMIGAAHELKRLGISNKILMIVPNNKLGDFERDWQKMYPNSRILSVSEENWNREERKNMLRRMSTSDWDCILMRHSSFETFGFTKEYMARYYTKQIMDAEEALRSASDVGLTKRELSSIEKIIKKLKKKLADLLAKPTDDEAPFDLSGIDALFLDEAHNFKNLLNVTRHTRLAGADTSDAEKTTRLHMATEYIHEHNGKVVFATATPMSNTIGEIYNMYRYLRPDILADFGMESYDGFISNFGDIDAMAEPTSTGTNMVTKERLIKFSNLPELISAFRSFSDVITDDSVKEKGLLKGLPESEEIHVTVESTDFLDKFNKWIDYKKAQLKGKKREKGQEGHLVLYKDAKMAALDLRMVFKLSQKAGIIPEYAKIEDFDLPGSKINTAVQNIYDEYKDSMDIKGTQVVFLDNGTPQKPLTAAYIASMEKLMQKEDSGEKLTDEEQDKLDKFINGKRYEFDLYADIKKKLVKLGIPENEIAFIQDTQSGNSQAKKNDLYDRVRQGDVRVLIGSTSMMGEGMNVQDRAIAVHNLDAPDRASDIIQRNARVVRQGNMNPNVKVFYYSTKHSFDAASWNRLDNKNKAMNAILNGDRSQREIEDLDKTGFETMSVEATANPLFFDRLELQNQIKKYEAEERNFNQQKYDYEDIIENYPSKQTELKQKKTLLEEINSAVNEFKEKLNKVQEEEKAYKEERKKQEAELREKLKKEGKDTKSVKEQLGEEKTFDKSIITVEGESFESLQKASVRLLEIAKDMMLNPSFDKSVKTHEIGTIYGVPLFMKQENHFGKYKFFAGTDNGDTTVYAVISREEGNKLSTGSADDAIEQDAKANMFKSVMTRLNNALNSLPEKIAPIDGQLTKLKKSYDDALKNVDNTFIHEEELRYAKDEFVKLNEVLGKTPAPTNPFIAYGEETTPYDDLIAEKAERLKNGNRKNEAELVKMLAEGRKQKAELSVNANGTVQNANRQLTGLYQPNAKMEQYDETNLESVGELMREMAHRFGVNLVRGGNYRKRKAAGYFMPDRNTIRTKQYNDISAFLHELGHKFDEVHDYSSNYEKTLDKIVNNFNAKTKKSYNGDKATLRGEAVAEFVRLYVVNPEGAREFVRGTNFENNFKDELSTKDLKDLEDFGKRIRVVLGSDVVERLKGTIHSRNEKHKSFKTLQDRVSDAYTSVFDENYPIKRLVDEVEKMSGKKIEPHRDSYILAQQYNRAGNIASNMLDKVGLHAPNSDVIVMPPLGKILEPVKNQMEDFDAYLKVSDALDLYANDKAVLPKDFTLNEMLLAKDKLEQKANFKETADKLYAWFEAFEKMWLVDTGFISNKTFDLLRNLYPHYVPRFRWISEEAKKGRSSSKVLKRMSHKGNDLESLKPTESIAYEVERIVKAEMRRDILLQLRDLYYDPNYSEAISSFITKENPDLQKTSIQTEELREKVKNRVVEKIISNLSSDDYDKLTTGTHAERAEVMKRTGITDAVDAVGEVIDDFIERYTPKTTADGFDVFTVPMAKYDADAGHDYDSAEFFKVTDPALINVLCNYNHSERGKLLQFLNGMKRAFTVLTTSGNVLFSLSSNMWRDIAQSSIQGSAKQPVSYTKDYIQAIIEQIKKGDYYKAYNSVGGGLESILGESKPYVQDSIQKITGYKGKNVKELAKYLISTMGGAIEGFNNAIETAPRLAEFKRILNRETKKGTKREDALLIASRAAAEVTTDFAQKGSSEFLSDLSMIIPFFRAGMNGLDSVYRTFNNGNHKVLPNVTQTRSSKGTQSQRNLDVAGNLAKALIYLTIPTILLALKHRDDDEYNKLPDYYKSNYWILNEEWFTGNNSDKGKFIRIPKPNAYGWLFSTTFDNALMEALDSEEDHGKAVVDAFVDTFLPSYNTVLAPFVDAWANTTWSGGTLVSSTFDTIYEGGYYDEVYDDTTSRIAVELAKVIPDIESLNYLNTPKGIEYVLQQTTGIIGQIALPATAPSGKSLTDTLLNKVTVDTTYSNRYVDKYYDIKNKLEAAESVGDSEVQDDVMQALFTSTAKSAVNDAIDNGVIIPSDSILNSLARVRSVSDSGEITYGISPSKRLSELWSEIRDLNNNQSLTKAERKVAIEECRNEINEITEAMVNVYNDYTSGKRGTVVPESEAGTLETKFTDDSDKTYQLSYDEYQKYQSTYRTTYNKLSKASGSSDVAKRWSKNVAKYRAQKTVKPLCSNYLDKFVGSKTTVDDQTIVEFRIQIDGIEGEDTQKRIIQAIKGMDLDGYTSYLLFHSKYNSDKNNPWRAYKN